MSDVSSKRLFKKYQQNRRLWDVAGACYATTQDIVEAVEMGQQIQVIAIEGRGKAQKEIADVTLEILLDALRLQQRAHRSPPVRVQDIINLMLGKTARWD